MSEQKTTPVSNSEEKVTATGSKSKQRLPFRVTEIVDDSMLKDALITTTLDTHGKIVSWGFSETSKDVPVDKLVSEIKKFARGPLSGARFVPVCSFDQKINLPNHCLLALHLADYPFNLQEIMVAASEANVQVLTWFRKHVPTQWEPPAVLTELSLALSAHLTRLDQKTFAFDSDPNVTAAETKLIADIEACFDLVFDARYSPRPSKKTTFPFTTFLREAAETESGVALTWFLDRAQFRYPLGPYFLWEESERIVTTAVSFLEGRHETLLAAKLKEFIVQHKTRVDIPVS